MADPATQSDAAKTNQLLHNLIAEVKSLKESQSSLELKLESLGLSFPSNYSAQSNPNPQPTGGDILSQSSHTLPAELQHLTAGSRPLPVPVTLSTSTSSSSSRVSKRGAFEDEGSIREKAKFVEWMKNEGALLGGDGNASEIIGKHATLYPQRLVLTTYPGQTGIHPIPLEWGASDPQKRGPVVASRHPQSLRIRNAIGAYSGPYCIYKALATAIGAIDPNHRPDFSNTQPPFDVSPNPSWFDPSKIVSMDPWGHLAPQLFKAYFDSGVDIRPTVACTKAHLKLAELDESAAEGKLLIDGKIVVKSPGTWAEKAAQTAVESTGGKWEALSEEERHLLTSKRAGVEVQVTKAAVEPVWNLPGVAARFGISEAILRRALFEDTGGMYPELLTRSDLKTYLPPIGGLTIYIFGDPNFVSDPSKELTLRVHDECNGSDVFGSSVGSLNFIHYQPCSFAPVVRTYFTESKRPSNAPSEGVVGLLFIFARKEELLVKVVTKYLVYNARKRGGDSAAFYFQRTESVAGVKDMRFQALMPDVLHWLGIKKIDVMCSMSDMKHDAIVQSGIPILLRKDIPEHLIPSDSRVEIDAKIAAGMFNLLEERYFSASKVVTEEDLKNTIGQRCEWEDVDH
ncbi:GTP cyclohydrolase II [Puccinia sorghi]|uniref:GTP cyclohydrolase II n=1 Tax=Puccinia sorghi TaxID=27349 RepID=A0A0L6V3R4_9BASI|nr:GTP cyclohydrolase II [Puccinia sorghi]